MPQVTIPNLFDLAPTLGVPTLPKLPPVFNMSFQDTVTQWMAANAMNLQVRAHPQQRQQQHAFFVTEPWCSQPLQCSAS
jgi:aromatic ring-cleaving dioxygenase